MNELQAVRTPEIIGAEIRHITYQVKCMTLYGGVEIGRRLKEAKERVPYGSFGEFLKKETEFSSSAAGRFMQLFDEYGAALTGGGELFPTLGKVSVSNALRLLALPSEEREEFAQEHDVEHLSTRELDKLLAERDEALKRAEGAELAMTELEEQIDILRSREKNNDALSKRLEEQLATAEQVAEDCRRISEELAAENEDLRNRPIEVAVEVDEEAVERAAAEAKSKADAEWAKKLEAAQKAKEKSEKNVEKLEAKLKLAEADAEKRCAEAVAPYEEKLSALSGSEEEIASLRKQLAMSGAEITTFRLRFDAWQQAFQQMLKSLEAVPEENRDKLHAAIKAAFDAQKSQMGGEGE